MHFVGRVDWDRVATPFPSSATAHGLARAVVVGPEQGAVHTEIAIGSFQAGGWLCRHFHSFEESLYVLGGELLLELDGTVHRLLKGDFALIPIGVQHTLGQRSRRAGPLDVDEHAAATRARRRPQGHVLREDAAGPRRAGRARRAAGLRRSAPALGRPLRRNAAAGRGACVSPTRPAAATSAGMDTALVVYSGISVKMLIDRVFGAELLTMFTVDYEPGGSAQQHDHPFEEAYFFLDGECEAELDGTVYTVRAGDVVFAGVGAVHGFYNNGTGRVRWIETQAPQPPARHAYRWVPVWKRFEEE